MNWEVRCTDADGEEVTLVVEADAEDIAVRRAERHGLRVKGIRMMPETIPGWVQPAKAVARGAKHESAPGLRGLHFWSAVLRGLAAAELTIAIAIAALIVIPGILEGGWLNVLERSTWAVSAMLILIILSAPSAVLGYGADALRHHIRRQWNE